MRCKCGRLLDPTESIGASLGLCQDCWEGECSESWWRAWQTQAEIKE